MLFPTNWKSLLAFLAMLLSPLGGQASQVDGDYVVNTLGNQFEWLSIGSGNTKWATNTVSWYYNPANAPSAFSNDELLGIVNSAMSKWQAVCNVKFSYQGQASTTLFKLDRINVIGWSTGLLSGNADGLTESWMQGSTVVDSDIAVWRDSPAQRAGSDKEQQRLELTGVFTHEIGHMLGLGHSDKSESIMFAKPYHSYLYTNTLRQDDIDGCVAKYGAAPITAPALTAITPSCPASLPSGTTGTCSAIGKYGDGTTKAIAATWASSDPAALSISASGALTAGNLSQDTTVTVTASASDGGVSRSGTAQIAVKAQLSTGLSDSERIFNWLENATQNMFLPVKAPTLMVQGYTYRYYSRTASFLATKDGRLYYYGSRFGLGLMDVGPISEHLFWAKSAGY